MSAGAAHGKAEEGDARRSTGRKAGGSAPAVAACGQLHSFGLDDEIPETVHSLEHLLEPSEVQRANRFTNEMHRTRFIVRRARTRQILAGVVGREPQELCFDVGEAGKPALPELAALGHSFNVSKSEGVGLVAIVNSPRVGVDLEVVRPGYAGVDVAERFFAVGEVARLHRLDPAEQELAFYRCWTRKEAFLKAHGTGLSVPLRDFEVSFESGVRPSLIRCTEALDSPLGWCVVDIADIDVPRQVAVAALVVETSPIGSKFTLDHYRHFRGGKF
jgi:4'-phosphopantetheinyl transferase